MISEQNTTEYINIASPILQSAKQHDYVPWSMSGGKPPTNTFLEYDSGRVPLVGKLAVDEV